jgi:hypothetical protein
MTAHEQLLWKVRRSVRNQAHDLECEAAWEESQGNLVLAEELLKVVEFCRQSERSYTAELRGLKSSTPLLFPEVA